MLQDLRRYSDIIASYQIKRFEQLGRSLRLRAEAELIDGSTLYIRETVIDGTKQKYAYHWQDKNKKLIIR